MKIENSKGASPYAKRGKKPFKYSEHYHRWANSLGRSGLYSKETIDADAAFRRAFNIPSFKRTATVYGGFR